MLYKFFKHYIKLNFINKYLNNIIAKEKLRIYTQIQC